MASHSTIQLTWSSFSLTELLNRYRKPADGKETLRRISKACLQLVTGRFNGGVRVQHATGLPVRASQTITVVQASLVNATSTWVSGLGVSMLAKTTATLATDFAIGTTNTEAATNLKNAINANATLSKYVIATSAVGVVTVTFLMAGSLNNLFATSASGGGLTVGAANYAGGAGMDNATVDAYSW